MTALITIAFCLATAWLVLVFAGRLFRRHEPHVCCDRCGKILPLKQAATSAPYHLCSGCRKEWVLGARMPR